jgi:hypothetical protein
MAVKMSPEEPARYAGAVLADREWNGRDDSDFYAVVWDEAEQKVKRVDYATTRFASRGTAVVDATPEVVRKARRWWRRVVLERALRDAQEEHAKPGRGKRVKVLRARRVKPGTEGVVKWEEANPFRTYYRNGYNHPESPSNRRVRVVTAAGQSLWFNAEQVEVVDPFQVNPFSLRRYVRNNEDGYQYAFAAGAVLV